MNALELKDVKPPVDLPANHFWLWVVLFVLSLIGIGLLVRRLREAQRQSKPPVVLPPGEIAEQELARLKSENLPSQGKIKEFYTRLSDIVRHYLEDQLIIRAPEMTTAEFFQHLKQTTVLSSEQRGALKNFLECCDMVKFAKYSSNLQETQQSFSLAKRLIEETRGKTQTAETETK